MSNKQLESPVRSGSGGREGRTDEQTYKTKRLQRSYRFSRSSKCLLKYIHNHFAYANNVCDRRTTHCDYHCFRHESCLPPHRLHERRRNAESLPHRSLFAFGQGKRNARSERLRISPDHHSIGHLTTGRVISSSSDSASASVVACHPRAAPPAARASTISSSMLKGTCTCSSS